MTRSTVWSALARPRFLLSSYPWRALGYALFSAVWALLWIAIALPTLLLLPLWGLIFGAVERRRTTWLGFERQQSPHVRIPQQERHHWLGIRLAEPATWREVAGVLADIVFGFLTLIVLATLAIALVLPVAFTIQVCARSDTIVTLWGETRFIPTTAHMPLFAAVVILALIVGAYLLAVVSGLQASVLRALCAPRDAELDERIARLTTARALLIRAQEDERRRIERDLHDGVQQELVALGARLALAELEADSGDGSRAVRSAIAEARDAADHALVSLRRTVNGLHPAVLSDRGLAAALAELTVRAPLDVRLDVDIPRLSASAETAAYYVVSEAITNAAKHSTATTMRVWARHDDGVLLLHCTDDGRGRVNETGGTGLAGLRERAASLSGTLNAVSGTRGVALELSLPAVAHPREETHPAHPAR